MLRLKGQSSHRANSQSLEALPEYLNVTEQASPSRVRVEATV
jgi:hypothetical protein